MRMMSRRSVVTNLVRGGVGAALSSSPLFALGGTGQEVSPGRYRATRESLAAYRIPTWYSDAKFGIWSHWGPQSAIEDGDWYARNMYIQGSNQYNYHCQVYGHPSKVGYKDVVPQFHAAKWDPDHLMDLYVKAGAKYFFSMGVHHDNFDMWNSKHQPRWNSVATGPKKDIVGMWAAAARKRNLYFGVSEHLSNSFDWLMPSHLSDTTGALAGVRYDGSDPAYADLYHDYAGMPEDFLNMKNTGAMGRNAPVRWKQQYFDRVRDLVDQHHPDLLYTDGGIPFDEFGLGTVAEVYNVSQAGRKGEDRGVYFSKVAADCKVGTCALDRERGVLEGISPNPWQTDTCIGSWHYQRGAKYKPGKKVIDLLVDIVSKNGNLLLNIPLPNSGEPDYQELAVLDEITAWMRLNTEGIHSSRPWKIFGEGPSVKVDAGAGFNESKKPDLGLEDVRFTTKGKNLYAFVMGWPDDEFRIKALGSASATDPGKIVAVMALGSDEKLRWTQEAGHLRISKPSSKLSDIGHGFRIVLA